MRDQTIALAGVYQAATMAHELANSGAIRDNQSWEVSLNSLYKLDASSTEDVFDNNLAGLALGCNSLIKSFNKDSYYINIIKYTITLLTLAAKLPQRDAMLDEIAKGLQDSKVLQTADDPLNIHVVSKLAQIYSKTISQMQPRVIVAGQPFHLKDQAITEKIRAILLAGIRSAILWKQTGGNQLQLLFKRKTYIEEAKRLLAGT
ncbi:high frequency lysogenization protein HflD [Marinicella sp. S1101]|uniref:high frequency lysogenization protein HflD n=1 Tax=Marinicella marina TaxID=2996016 RepID=UPI0022609109|nr:high frequency lysogenization protein HflD [Marinicella marina]MCX7553519.1 high frequency lysogenization protein HflD [Marinicella marina]MDJ1140143.1 high frequency lysogenization protein HflD [Marinicella marina]